MKKNTLLALLFLIGFSKGNSQVSPRDQVIQLSETYGFLHGQNLSLQWIKDNFPDLKNSATQAALRWDLEFGKVEIEVKRQLQVFLKDEFDQYLTLAKQKHDELISFDNLSKQDAISFINTVNERAKGNIAEQFKANVLMYHPEFIKHPHEEFIRGYRNEFKSTGQEIKSKGIKMRIQYPASWKEIEGVRPNIFLKAINKNGKGETAIFIIIKDLAKELKGQVSNDELAHLFSREGNRELANEIVAEKSLIEMGAELQLLNSKFNNYKRLEIDGNPGAKIDFSGHKKRLEYEFPMYVTQCVTISKNYVVILAFSSSGDTIEEAKVEFENNQALFSLIINSIAIFNRYE